MGWREGFAEVVKLEVDGGVRVAGENAPRGACMSSGNNGDRAKLDNRSAVENAPRGAHVSPCNSEAGRSFGPPNSIQNTLDGSCALKMPLVPMADRDKPNTPLIRQQVLSRDGQSCATPGCTQQGELFSHHVKWRSLGGRTHLINEVCVCQRCHSLIHEGLLKLEGTAPHGLRWYGADGEPLETVDECSFLEGFRKTGLRYRTESHADTPRSAPRGAPRGAQAEASLGIDATRENNSAKVEDTTIYSLDEVPDKITHEWWQKYKHNFYFKGNRMMLKKT